MKRILIVSVLMLWTVGLSENVQDAVVAPPLMETKSLVKDLEKAVKSGVKKATDIIKCFRSTINPNCTEPPKECPNANITFWYYSRSNPETPMELSISDLKDVNDSLKNEYPWKIIIHGYTKSKNDIPNPQLRSAYFKKGEYNVISVDYEPLARDNCYIHAVANVPLIANCTAQMIDALIDKQLFNSDNLHIIGFSLGAHVAGLIHTYMKHPKPSRVTGLDPASPLFDGYLNAKLNPDAGEFVDVIHTNALIKGELETAGDVDFYVNGGISQPGCASDSNESFSSCNHNRSPLYFAESINSNIGFWGIPCRIFLTFFSGLCNHDKSHLILMGEYVPRDARGIVYLRTKSKEPFALGKQNSAYRVLNPDNFGD